MPAPTKGESKKDYIARFMGSPEANKTFPDQKQRYAVALSNWKKQMNKAASNADQSCMSCGMQNDPEADFCDNCGMGMDEQACPSCGATNDPNANYCDACGTYLKGQPVMAKFDNKSDGVLLKIDAEEKRVFGIFSLAKKNGQFLIDSQDDIIDTKDLEDAAYEFVLKARIAGHNHTKTTVGRLIESMVFTKEKLQFLKQTLEKAGVKDVNINIDAEFWWGAFQIDNEEVWGLVKSGDLTSFSIGGTTNRYKIG